MKSSSAKREKIWQQILDSSEKMEAVAQQNDWQQLSKLIDTRQKLLNRFFSKSVAQNQLRTLHQIRADIKLILDQDERTKSLSQANNTALLKGIRALNKGKLVAKSYQ